ncbi:MAG: hypothetical protein RLZZ584_1110 [Pseudomonadota bacterium]
MRERASTAPRVNSATGETASASMATGRSSGAGSSICQAETRKPAKMDQGSGLMALPRDAVAAQLQGEERKRDGEDGKHQPPRQARSAASRASSACRSGTQPGPDLASDDAAQRAGAQRGGGRQADAGEAEEVAAVGHHHGVDRQGGARCGEQAVGVHQAVAAGRGPGHRCGKPGGAGLVLGAYLAGPGAVDGGCAALGDAHELRLAEHRR